MRTKLTAVLTALSLLITPLSPAITIASAAEEAMVISTDGLELIKELEGFSSEAYQSGGQWYIGYGTGCEEADYPDGITQDEAEELLLEALDDMGNTLSAWLEDYEVTPTQAQFDALLSFTYNLGEGWMTEDCSLVDLLAGSSDSWTDIDLVNAFGVWCHADGAVNSVLVQRRLREACLFLYEDYTGEYTEAFVSVTLDAGEGTVEQDIVFYERGQPLEFFQARNAPGMSWPAGRRRMAGFGRRTILFRRIWRYPRSGRPPRPQFPCFPMSLKKTGSIPMCRNWVRQVWWPDIRMAPLGPMIL